MNRSIGILGAGNTTVATVDTPFCLFSGSKAITAMLVHLLEEHGLLSVRDPVTRYIPAFGKHGKQHVTLEDLLVHRGGIASLGRQIDPTMLLDQAAVLDALCDLPFVGDHRPRYHAVTAGFVLAAIVQVVTGADIREYMRIHVQEPMGFQYFNYGLPATAADRVAKNEVSGLRLPGFMARDLTQILGVDLDTATALSNQDVFYQAIIPGANIFATANECSAFFQCLLDGGRYQGRQIFARRTVAAAVREVVPLQKDQVLKLPMRYSAGMMLGHAPLSLYGRRSNQAFGHLGLTNNLCWADPQRQISVAILTSGNPVLGSHLPAYFRLVGAINAFSEVVDAMD